MAGQKQSRELQRTEEIANELVDHVQAEYDDEPDDLKFIMMVWNPVSGSFSIRSSADNDALIMLLKNFVARQTN